MTTPGRVHALAVRLLESRGADLLRYLRQRLGSDVEARDIAQETYLRLIRLGNPALIENPEAYLFRIASNLLWEHRLRARKVAGQAPLDQDPVAEHTPMDLAITAETEKRLRHALGRLPFLQRSILILHLRDDLTCSEISAQSGISASMVKKHLHSALAVCRRYLRDYE